MRRIIKEDRYDTYTAQGQIFYIYQDSIVCYARSGRLLHKINERTKRSRYIFRAYLNEQDNKMFMATVDGLYLNDSALLFPNQKVYSITQDINGHYWVAIDNQGVYKIRSWTDNPRYYSNVYQGTFKHAFADSGSVYFAVPKDVLVLVEERWGFTIVIPGLRHPFQLPGFRVGVGHLQKVPEAML